MTRSSDQVWRNLVLQVPAISSSICLLDVPLCLTDTLRYIRLACYRVPTQSKSATIHQTDQTSRYNSWRGNKSCSLETLMIRLLYYVI